MFCTRQRTAICFAPPATCYASPSPPATCFAPPATCYALPSPPAACLCGMDVSQEGGVVLVSMWSKRSVLTSEGFWRAGLVESNLFSFAGATTKSEPTWDSQTACTGTLFPDRKPCGDGCLAARASSSHMRRVFAVSSLTIQTTRTRTLVVTRRHKLKLVVYSFGSQTCRIQVSGCYPDNQARTFTGRTHQRRCRPIYGLSRLSHDVKFYISIF